jgi:hypothetical protein
MAEKHLSDTLLERSLARLFAADCLDRKDWDRFRLTPVIRTSVLRLPVRLTPIARFRRSALTPHSHRGQPASSPLAENCYLIHCGPNACKRASPQINEGERRSQACQVAFFMASFTLSEVIGSPRTRAPTALKIAFPIAGELSKLSCSRTPSFMVAFSSVAHDRPHWAPPMTWARTPSD